MVALIQKGRGAHFDPLLAELFLANLDRFRIILLANPDEAHDVDPGV